MYKKICITNRQLAEDFMKQLEMVCLSDVDMIILREKDLPEDEYLTLSKKAIEICKKYNKELVLHTFKEVAKELGINKIHLSMDNLRAMSPIEKEFFYVIGASVHSVKEAKDAEKLGATYVTISHIFATDCKKGLEPRGINLISDTKKAVKIPVYALGGIHPSNIDECLEAGADGVCMMSEYMKMKNDRYDRQMLLEGIGSEGQASLRNARVLIVGAGGLGSPVISYLAGAGIGTIGIVDADTVSLSNLHRQVIHKSDNVGMNKAESAKLHVEELNNSVNVITYPLMLDSNNICDIVKGYDFVVCCVDNFETRFIINDTCVLLGKPFCNGGVLKAEGQVFTYVPDKGPCYRCIFEEIPEKGSVPTTSEVGVVGPIVGLIGCMQAMEVIKYFTHTGELLAGKIFSIDLMTMKTKMIRISERSEFCRVCGTNADITEVISENY